MLAKSLFIHFHGSFFLCAVATQIAMVNSACDGQTFTYDLTSILLYGTACYFVTNVSCVIENEFKFRFFNPTLTLWFRTRYYVLKCKDKDKDLCCKLKCFLFAFLEATCEVAGAFSAAVAFVGLREYTPSTMPKSLLAALLHSSDGTNAFLLILVQTAALCSLMFFIHVNFKGCKFNKDRLECRLAFLHYGIMIILVTATLSTITGGTLNIAITSAAAIIDSGIKVNGYGQILIVNLSSSILALIASLCVYLSYQIAFNMSPADQHVETSWDDNDDNSVEVQITQGEQRNSTRARSTASRSSWGL